MLNYLLRRLLNGLLVLFGVVTVVFFIFNIKPGDPARMLADQRSSPGAGAAADDAVRALPQWRLAPGPHAAHRSRRHGVHGPLPLPHRRGGGPGSALVGGIEGAVPAVQLPKPPGRGGDPRRRLPEHR